MDATRPVRPTRRELFQGSACALLGTRVARLARPSDALRVAVVGLNGRGAGHVEALRAMPGVRVVALCDVDELLLMRTARTFRERGETVGTHVDFRHLLERKDVDALTLATPDHWHALQAIWACQAGKDVYLEAPATHAFGEGAPLVAAAVKHGRLVQCGLDARSSPAVQGALEWLAAGSLGAPELVRVLCYEPRPPIGKTRSNQQVPETVDYDLWCGPAPLVPLRRAHLHHDWRWSFGTGGGDLASQGVHELDVALRVLASDAPPKSVVSLGGRLGADDDGETPNTLVVFYAFEPVPLLFELRGLPRDAAAQAGDWGARMDDFLGVRTGVVVHCAGGTLRIARGADAVAHDLEGREQGRWSGAGNALAGWIAALQSRRVEDLTAGVELGVRASGLCHLGNASYRLGKRDERAALEKALASSAVLTATLARLLAHLDANGIDLAQRPLALGPCLTLDPSSSCYTGDVGARPLLQGRYREPFVLPAV